MTKLILADVVCRAIEPRTEILYFVFVSFGIDTCEKVVCQVFCLFYVAAQHPCEETAQPAAVTVV